jgi:hypothetical protein
MTRNHAPKRFHSRKTAGVTARPTRMLNRSVNRALVRNARVIALSVALSLGAAGLGSIAEAKTIKILEADRLELRNVIPPGGGESQELVIITGTPAIIQVDDDELEADRIEYNKTKRTLSVIGNGIYRTKTETVAGQDFSVDLETQGLDGEDVLISTKEIDVVGVSAERVPGQLDVVDGYFSPCARCGRTPNDYGFRAESLTLYPGDRLIGRNVTVLIADEPVMFLPIVVLLLNDPSRQPRLDINNPASDSPDDGLLIEADLPFVTGDYGIGFTFLRYFQNRTPSFGVGFEWQLYNLFEATNQSKLFFLILPPKPKVAGSSTGFGVGDQALLAYQLDSKGVIELTPGAEPEDALPDIKFEANITRADTGIKSEDLRGVTGTDQRTDYKLKLDVATPEYNASLVANGAIDHRDLSKLKADDPSRENFGNLTQLMPEFSFNALGGWLPKFEPFSVTSFGFTLGNVRANVDGNNTSARREAGTSPYISAGRFTLNYGLSFNQPLWEGANLTANQGFTGRYYTTRNPSLEDPTQPGEFERNIQTNLNAGFSQTLLGGNLTFGANYNYAISEGESPFADGFNFGRRPASETGSLNVGARPFDWLSLSASDSINFRKTEFKWDPANFGANLNATQGNPLQASSSLTYDIERGEAHLWNFSTASSSPSGLSFSVSFGYDFVTTDERRNQINNPNARPLEDRWTDWNSTIGYRTEDSKFNASLGLRLNLNTGDAISWTLSSGATIGDRDTPVTLSLNETYSPTQERNNRTNDPINTLTPSSVTPPRLDGNFSINWSGYRFNFSNNFDWRNFEYSANTPSPPSSVNFSLASTASSNGGNDGGNQQGQPVPGEIPSGWTSSWNVQLGSRLDLDPVEFFDTKLNGTLQLSSNPLTLNANAIVSLPDRNRTDIELSNFGIDLGWDVLPGIAIQGGINYNRSWGTNFSKTQDAFTFTPLGMTIALAGEGSSKPDVFLTMLLSGTYTFQSENPDLPFYTPANGGTSGFSGLRPKFILTFDRCCWSLQLTFDATRLDGASFAISFKLPIGGSKDLITADNSGIKFPILPFIPAIKP